MQRGSHLSTVSAHLLRLSDSWEDLNLVVQQMNQLFTEVLQNADRSGRAGQGYRAAFGAKLHGFESVEPP